jgi:hypothetical protein
MLLKNDYQLREKIAQNGYLLYLEKLTPQIITQQLLKEI